MGRIAASLGFALLNLFHRRILWLMLWPVLIAVALWGTVVVVFWAQAVVWLGEVVREWLQRATFFLTWDATVAAAWTAKLLIVILVVPLIQLTALLILGVFGMPEMVAHVSAVRFPQLARRQGGSFMGSLANGLAAIGGLLLLGVVTAPLWLVPFFWPLLPPALFGWVNQRVLRYDAASEHATAQEMRELFAANRGPLYALGFLLAMAAYVPIVGWFAPVLFALATIHLLLVDLEARRNLPIEGRVLDAEVLPPG